MAESRAVLERSPREVRFGGEFGDRPRRFGDRQAVWIIDLGPEGGDEGGRLMAEGSPASVAQVEASYTGQYLKRYFAPGARKKSRASRREKVVT